MAVKTSDRFYSDVAGTSTATKDYVVPNGETLVISEVHGEAGSSPDTIVMIIWDEVGANELIYSTHASGTDLNVGFSAVGDGVKKLTIKLKNDQATTDCLGLSWRD